jgi:hypothetical protein
MSNITYIIIACYPDQGMKSYGSKSLMSFNNVKLLEYQLSIIHQTQRNKGDYEIIVVCDFDHTKIEKLFNNKVRIVKLTNHNPVFTACLNAKYSNILFIDYGCIFNKSLLDTMLKKEMSQILCIKKYNHGKLDIGCLNSTDGVYMYLDLPDNKFCNMFLLSETNITNILSNSKYSVSNLLHFEIINMLIEDGHKMYISYANNNSYIYFNNMRQKNAINKFISQK